MVPNRGAFVPEVTSEDVLEVYAMRAALGSLALHKVMLANREGAIAPLSKQLQRFKVATARKRASDAAEADLGYQSTLVACAGLPRVAREFDRLTWQVRIFISRLDVHYDEKLALMRDELVELHTAIVSDDEVLAEQLWRAKFERWVRDFLSELPGGFDIDLWVALTAGLGGSLS